jgi:putative transposase
VHPTLRRYIEGLALQKPPATIATIHRQAVTCAQEHDWGVPSYGTVYAIVRALDPALVTYAHQGAKVYNDTYDVLYRREAGGPNAVWQADHCLLDLWLRDERGQPMRPWLTIIQDDYSRAIAGYMVTFQEPSALQTALVLRQAIWRKSDPRWHICGIPGQFYTDHGSDFISQHIEQVCIDLKIELIFSQVGVPRGRGRIERFFQTVNQLLLCRLPGYIAEGTSRSAATLTLADLDARFCAFLLDEYHQRVQRETGMAPQARWEAGGFLPHMPESLEHLDVLLLTVARPRRVHQDGIRFEGYRYIDLALAAYVGEDVTIRYDPRDMAEIRVYYQNAFLCRAICQELAGETISLKDIQHARNQRRRQVREQVADRQNVVTDLTAGRQPEPPTAAGEASAPAEPPRPRLKRYYHE